MVVRNAKRTLERFGARSRSSLRNIQNIALAWCVLLIVLGCSGYQAEKSGVVLPAPLSGSDQLPLAVGLKITGQSLSGGFTDMGPIFASRLASTNLFKSIVFPVSTTDKSDLLIEANFSGKHVGDSATFAKGFFTGLFLFLPSPAVEYEDHYITTSVIVVTQGAQQVRSYSAGSDIAVKSKLMASDEDIQKEGIAAATKELMDRLIAQFHNDRTVFAGLHSSSQ